MPLLSRYSLDGILLMYLSSLLAVSCILWSKVLFKYNVYGSQYNNNTDTSMIYVVNIAINNRNRLYHFQVANSFATLVCFYEQKYNVTLEVWYSGMACSSFCSIFPSLLHIIIFINRQGMNGRGLYFTESFILM